MYRLYLAGPDVFLPDAVEQGEKKVKICENYGIKGLYPLDNEVDFNPERKPEDIAMEIYHGNISMMNHADGILANLTPFRGPSADPGTAFEVGYFTAMNKRIWCYTNNHLTLEERIDHNPATHRDRDGYTVEPFNQFDNLMLACSGKVLMSRPYISKENQIKDLVAFEEMVYQISTELGIK